MPGVGAWCAGAGRSRGTYDIVNEPEEPEMLPYSQTGMLAWHSFVDADERCEASGSDTKDHPTRSNSSSHNISVVFTAHGPSVPRMSGEGDSGTIMHSGSLWGQDSSCNGQ